MRLGKLAAGVPAALLVGVMVHIAAAGFDHIPGGRSAVPLAVGVTIALLLSLAVAFGRGAFGGVYRSIATSGELAYATVALGFAGTASYFAIELLEGHTVTSGALRALAASFPAAILVLAVFRRARRAAANAGMRLGSFLRRRRGDRVSQPRFVAHEPLRRFTRRRREGRQHAGRAPPLFA
jgi:hypothetical protein